MTTAGTPVMWMRGGTSKGAYFVAEDLPSEPTDRDALLLRIMGSPDPNQIDGMGGANPLTSKVAVVSVSDRSDADLDYLFLQVMVDQPVVTDAQNCGNILAGVAPFALERGLLAPQGDVTQVRIFMANTGQVATATVPTPGGQVNYDGDSVLDGVPGSHAALPLTFSDVAGSKCGALLPTGNVFDVIEGVYCTLIDNGMPCVVMKAEELGVTGYETLETLEANSRLRHKLEAIRARAGQMMTLGDTSDLSVPKMVLVSKPTKGGCINTRTFIPHRCHKTIGVFQAVTVATAAAIPGSPAHDVAQLPKGTSVTVGVEQPAGITEAALVFNHNGEVAEAGIVRTARKLMDGVVF